MAIKDYVVMTGSVELNVDPQELSNDEAQQAVAVGAMGNLFERIGNAESGQGFGKIPAGTPWELVSHTVTVVGRQVVASGVLRFTT